MREDGRGDPVLVLHTAEARARLRRSQGPDLGAVGGTGHPVRDRLLAKARAAAAARSLPRTAPEEDLPSDAEPAAALDSEPPAALEPAFDALGEAADDLDLIGAPERRRSSGGSAAPLNAATVLLIGTLLGVVSLALLFAALIHVAPPAPLELPPPSEPPVAAPAPPPADPPVASTAVSLRAAPVTLPGVRREPRQPKPPPWRIADAANDPNLRRVTSHVGNNTFVAAVQNKGLSRREAYRLVAAFEGVKNLDRCRPRDSWSALLDAKGRVAAFEYSVSEEEVYQAREREGVLVAQRLDLEVRRERVEGLIVVRGSFEDSAQQAGFEPGLAAVVDKALAGHTSVKEMKDGDVLALVAQEVSMLGRFQRYAGVEALEYQRAGAAPLRVYYHSSDKARVYVDARGRTFGKSRWARPIPGAGVSSRYNPRRLHPILKRIRPHNGTDFGAPTGTPILASAAGRVSFVGRAGPNGNMVRLSHAGGYETGYSHLSRHAKGLKVGAKVEQKQVIGYVGSTGRSTGPHLHFSAKRGGRFIDPESLNLDGFTRIPLSDRDSFTALRQRYDQLLDALSMQARRAQLSPALAAASVVSDDEPADGEPADD